MANVQLLLIQEKIPKANTAHCASSPMFVCLFIPLAHFAHLQAHNKQAYAHIQL